MGYRLTELHVIFLGFKWNSPYWQMHLRNAIVGKKRSRYLDPDQLLGKRYD
ncbi:hypothetical protein LCGC14_1933890 [marine sediment metagenome]|uniref:Uncharacterized protein n=1 Tax=marine sediment metagenome TaxID=412755 RepID=A0A0F9FMB1_9ZZZZ